MILAKHGRYGPYLQVGLWSEEDRKEKINKPHMVSIPKDMSIETITVEEALELLKLPRLVGKTESGDEITALIGPYGPYMKVGKKNVSLPEEYNPIKVTEAEARIIIVEDVARREEMKKPLATLGEDPTSKGEIQIKNGRFGPYVTDGKTNVSIPKKIEPLTVNLEQAIEMLIKKRAKKGKGGWGSKKKKAPAKKKAAKKKEKE